MMRLYGETINQALSKTRFALIAGALLACNGTWAQSPDHSTPSVSFKGFGTLGLTHITEDQADLLANPLVEYGAGHTDSWSYLFDSRLGAQLDARFNSQFSGQLQVTAEQRHDGDIGPEVEWANIKYQPTSSFSIQVGRIVLPSFLVSDHRLVGYANHWARPPGEVYSLVPVTNVDGVSVRYRKSFNEVHNTSHISFGNNESKGPDNIRVTSKDGWNFTNTTEYGALTFNVTYQQGTVELDYPKLQQLLDLYRSPAFGAAGQALAEKYDPSSKKIDFIAVGASYDPGHWFAMGEWGQLNMRSILGKRSGWYVTSGYRTGSLTPYVIYSQSKMRSATSDPGLISPFVPVDDNAALNAALNDTLAKFNATQNTIAAGVRWDFAKQAALKLQFDHVDLGDGAYGQLRNVQPGFTPGGSYNMFSVTLDFLF